MQEVTITKEWCYQCDSSTPSVHRWELLAPGSQKQQGFVVFPPVLIHRTLKPSSISLEYYGLGRQDPSGKQALKVWFPAMAQLRGDWILKSLPSLTNSLISSWLNGLVGGSKSLGPCLWKKDLFPDSLLFSSLPSPFPLFCPLKTWQLCSATPPAMIFYPNVSPGLGSQLPGLKPLRHRD